MNLIVRDKINNIVLSLIEILDQEIKRGRYPYVETSFSENYLILKNYKLPAGYNQSTCSIAIEIPVAYPYQPPQNFLLSKNVELLNGIPRGRFRETITLSNNQCFNLYTLEVKHWNPNKDTIITFLNLIKIRLETLK